MFFSLVALTNLVDLLDALGAIDWRFLDSGNYESASALASGSPSCS
jgi:hypothetical protein